MGIGYNPRIVTDGLVLCLDAANAKSYPGSGNTWTDLSGNGNNGTLTNGPTFSSSLNGGSLSFDGVDDITTFSKTWNDMKGSNWNGYLTLEGVFRTTSVPTNSAMGYFGFNSANAYFKFMNTGNLFIDSGSTVPSRIITNCITTFSNYYGTWAHVAGVYDGTVKTYYNGILMNTSGSFTLADISSLNFSVGVGMGYYNFQGNFSTVKVYNRALSAAEIQQNFNAARSRYGI
jgi:hypothetical protein